jgi:hypothetical protein
VLEIVESPVLGRKQQGIPDCRAQGCRMSFSVLDSRRGQHFTSFADDFVSAG